MDDLVARAGGGGGRLRAAGCAAGGGQPCCGTGRGSGRPHNPGCDGRNLPAVRDAGRQKNIIGFDIDLINEICNLANCKPQIQSVAWEGVLAGVQKGDFDVAISGITITQERAQTVDFTEPYIEVGQVVMVRADEARITGVDDLADKVVAVQIGTTNDELATKLQKEGRVHDVRRYRTFDLAVQALLNRDVDSVIIDSVAGQGYMGANPGRLKIVGAKLTSEQLGVVVRKGNQEVLDAFNAALRTLRDNGTLDRLNRKWFEEWKPPK